MIIPTTTYLHCQELWVQCDIDQSLWSAASDSLTIKEVIEDDHNKNHGDVVGGSDLCYLN